MLKLAFALLPITLLATLVFAKTKDKNLLPAYVLAAHTVSVIIDPSAGISIEDPRANETARKNVESALLAWGRLEPTLSTQTADLLIVIRKGNGRSFNETIPDARQNNRPGSIDHSDGAIAGSAQRGPRPTLSDDGGFGGNPRTAGPQTEVGGAEDSFVVYQGGVDHPLDRAPAWRYRGQDALQPGSMPGVSAFRKAVADAEKAAAKQP